MAIREDGKEDGEWGSRRVEQDAHWPEAAYQEGSIGGWFVGRWLVDGWFLAGSFGYMTPDYYREMDAVTWV